VRQGVDLTLGFLIALPSMLCSLPCLADERTLCVLLQVCAC